MAEYDNMQEMTIDEKIAAILGLTTIGGGLYGMNHRFNNTQNKLNQRVKQTTNRLNQKKTNAQRNWTNNQQFGQTQPIIHGANIPQKKYNKLPVDVNGRNIGYNANARYYPPNVPSSPTISYEAVDYAPIKLRKDLDTPTYIRNGGTTVSDHTVPKSNNSSLKQPFKRIDLPLTDRVRKTVGNYLLFELDDDLLNQPSKRTFVQRGTARMKAYNSTLFEFDYPYPRPSDKTFYPLTRRVRKTVNNPNVQQQKQTLLLNPPPTVETSKVTFDHSGRSRGKAPSSPSGEPITMYNKNYKYLNSKPVINKDATYTPIDKYKYAKQSNQSPPPVAKPNHIMANKGKYASGLMAANVASGFAKQYIDPEQGSYPGWIDDMENIGGAVGAVGSVLAFTPNPYTSGAGLVLGGIGLGTQAAGSILKWWLSPDEQEVMINQLKAYRDASTDKDYIAKLDKAIKQIESTDEVLDKNEFTGLMPQEIGPDGKPVNRDVDGTIDVDGDFAGGGGKQGSNDDGSPDMSFDDIYNLIVNGEPDYSAIPSRSAVDAKIKSLALYSLMGWGKPDEQSSKASFTAALMSASRDVLADPNASINDKRMAAKELNIMLDGGTGYKMSSDNIQNKLNMFYNMMQAGEASDYKKQVAYMKKLENITKLNNDIKDKQVLLDNESKPDKRAKLENDIDQLSKQVYGLEMSIREGMPSKSFSTGKGAYGAYDYQKALIEGNWIGGLISSNGVSSSSNGVKYSPSEIRAFAANIGNSSINPDSLATIIMMESNGNTGAISDTGATGLGQHTEDAISDLERIYPSKYSNLSKDMLVSNPQLAVEASHDYLKIVEQSLNSEPLVKSRMNTNDENRMTALYAGYNLGAKGAKELFTWNKGKSIDAAESAWWGIVRNPGLVSESNPELGNKIKKAGYSWRPSSQDEAEQVQKAYIDGIKRRYVNTKSTHFGV